MCDQIWADYHKAMNDEFTMPLAMLAQEGETEMNRLELIEKTFALEAPTRDDWKEAFYHSIQAEDRFESLEQYEAWLYGEPNLQECERIRQEVYDFCNM